MNFSAENIEQIRELVRSGYQLKARDAKDLLGHNDHLVELLEARGRLVLGVEIERDQLNAENEALRKRIDDMSPFKGAPLNGLDLKCLACGGYHYGLQGLPCPNMRITASAAMGKGEQS